jgi:hypothetical protein
MVDVVAGVKPGAYDRALIASVLIVPLALLGLSKWRASLDTWYASPGKNATYLDGSFQADAAYWISTANLPASSLILVVDPNCPCTNSAKANLQSAVSASNRRETPIIVRAITATPSRPDAAWQAVVNKLPSTPTLLAVSERKLVYAGPANSGNLCTTAVEKAVGLRAVEAPPSRPLINWLERGCYCSRRGKQGSMIFLGLSPQGKSTSIKGGTG